MAYSSNTGCGSDWGFVYLIGHPQMPDVYKIGKTINHPARRCRDLGRSTSSPGDFSLLAYVESNDHSKLERDTHIVFEEFRVTESREFFKLSAVDLTTVLFWMSENGFGDVRIPDCEGLLVGALVSGIPSFWEKAVAALPKYRGDIGVVESAFRFDPGPALMEMIGKGVIG